MRKIYKFLFSTCTALLLNGFLSVGVSHAATPMVAASATNGRHTCALTASGGIECWGRNTSGQLGNGTTTNSNRAVDVSGFTSGGAAVTTGEDHSCALNSSGVVSCWGGNTYGQLGNGTNTSRSTPATVTLSGTAIAVAATGYTTCALTSTGAVQCWGLNGAGQLGNGTMTNRNTPVSVTGLTSGVVAIAGGGSGYICALTSSGAVKCWGDNTSGSLGNGSTTYAYTPTSVSGLSSGVAAITAGSGHACALTTAGAVKCWGSNSYGQLGNATTNNSLIPIAVTGMSSGISAISAGGFHTCAITTTGAVKCWGYNADGQLGTGSIPTSSPWGITSPTAVSGLSTTASSISAGFKHTCVVTGQGKVDCWGSNQSGQLGNGTTVTSSSPVHVSNSAGILDLQTDQNITFSGQTILYVGNTATVSAIASSGLTVTFGTSTPSVCSVSGSSVLASAAGTCTVTGNQPGNTGYRAATQTTQNIYVIPVTVPAAPTAVSATLGNASAVVTFVAPTNNGGSTITGYTVTASPGGLAATGTASPITITGLTNGTAYSFTVKANNSVGSSATGSTVGSLSPVAPAAVLTAPSAVSALAGNAFAVVSFTGSSTLTTKLTGSGTLIGTPSGTQNYNFLEIDTSKYPSGGSMAIKVTLGNGTSGASYDLFHSNAVAIDAAGRPVGSLANRYDVSPGSVTNMSYTFSPTTTNKYKLGLEGNWFSATSATNTYTYEVTLTGNASAPSYTVTSTPGGVTATGTTSPITVTGLTNNTAYTFAVGSSASAVSSAASSASAAVTPLPVVPGSPTSVSATPSNASAAVSFIAPTSNGGATITGYTVTASPGGQTATGTASPITISGLTNGTAYTFTVKATNSAGTGVASSSSSSVTPATVPAAPTAVSATLGNASAVVSFVPPTNNGGAAITGYTVTASPGGLTATGATSPITITGLTNGTAYTFSVKANNSVGSSAAGSTVGSLSPAAPATVLTGPTSVSAVAGNSSAVISFTGLPTLSTKLTGSGTLIGTPIGTQNYNFLEIDTSKYPSGGSMTIKVTLGNGTSAASYDLFHADAVAVDAGGRPVGSLANGYDVRPGSVTNMSYTFSPTATNKYKLGLEGNWFSATSATNTYTYEVTLTGNAAAPIYTVTSTPGDVTATGTTSPITVAGLTNGTAYTFTVKATNSVGTGGASTASAAVTPATIPAAPTAVSATLGNASAVVSFVAPTNNGGAAISGYTVTASPGGLTATGTTSPITITGLTNGTAYSFAVTANNSMGSSAAGSIVGSLSPAAPAAVLTAPTGVTAVAGNASATVSFTGSANLTTKLIGNGSLTGTPGGTQNYNFLEIDTSKYPSGGSMSIKITLGTGRSGASFDLFRSDAASIIGADGRPVGSLANAYDFSPGSVVNRTYAFGATPGKYRLAIDGNWGSPTTATNTYTYEVTLTGNTSTPSYTVTSTPGGVKATGTTSPITVTGLTNGTAYTFAVSSTASAVTSAASSASAPVTPVAPTGTSTTTVAATTTTTAASGQKQTLSLSKGWNLIGSGGTQAFSVRDYFNDKSKIVTVWKWLNGQSQWAFFSPQLSSTELQTYADAKGYKALDAINGLDGFWVNASDAVQVDVPFGSAYTAVDHRNSLIKGWNLIAAGESLTPVRFNNYLTPYSGDVPPSIGSDTTTTVYQVNLTSLWAWDAVAMSWYFYAPSLDRDMTLNEYTTGKGYLSFSGNNKKVGPGVGFWVNKP